MFPLRAATVHIFNLSSDGFKTVVEQLIVIDLIVSQYKLFL